MNNNMGRRQPESPLHPVENAIRVWSNCFLDIFLLTPAKAKRPRLSSMVSQYVVSATLPIWA